MATKKNTDTPKPVSIAKKPAARPARQRAVASGDIPPRLTKEGIEGFTVNAAVDGAQESKMGAMRDVMAGEPPAASPARRPAGVGHA